MRKKPYLLNICWKNIFKLDLLTNIIIILTNIIIILTNIIIILTNIIISD